MPRFNITLPEPPIHRNDVKGQILRIETARPGSGEYAVCHETDVLPLANDDNSNIIVPSVQLGEDDSVRLKVQYVDGDGKRVVTLEDTFVCAKEHLQGSAIYTRVKLEETTEPEAPVEPEPEPADVVTSADFVPEPEAPVEAPVEAPPAVE